MYYFRTLCYLTICLLSVILSCSSSRSNGKVAGNAQESDEKTKADSFFAVNIPPEFARLKGRVVQKIEPSDIKSDGVRLHFKVEKVIGYGSTFSTVLNANDTLAALTKFGFKSIDKNSVDSIVVGTEFIAEMQGNPIIANQYTIYKLLLIE